MELYPAAVSVIILTLPVRSRLMVWVRGACRPTCQLPKRVSWVLAASVPSMVKVTALSAWSRSVSSLTRPSNRRL